MVFTAITSLIIIIIIFVCYYIYRIAFYSPPGKHPKPDDPMKGRQYHEVEENIRLASQVMEKFTFEPVTIESFDGTTLYGRYYHLNDDAPLEILFHGYRSCAFRDCSGGHALARKMGFNTQVIDQRAHGESGGTVITFGVKERQDCKCWIEYAVSRFGSDIPILLSGLSMGAATVLMAAELELPQNVACIMADSPYSTPSAIIEKVCKDMHYPVALFRPFLHLSALMFGHFRLNACNAKDAVSHTRIPILLIHGEADHFVPCEMTCEIKAAGASRIDAYTFPGAGHGLSYIIDPLRYERVTYEFLSSLPSIAPHISPKFISQLDE